MIDYQEAYPSSALHQCLHRVGTTLEKMDRSAHVLTEAIQNWLNYHPLSQSLVIVEDSPPALCALVAALVPLDVPLHAVTTDSDPYLHSTLRGLGATPHLVESYADAEGVWRDIRSAVVVFDINLGSGQNGLSLLMDVGRGPRAVLISSECQTDQTRLSAERASTLAHAESVFRTGSGAWEEELRTVVSRLLWETRSIDP